MADAGLHVLKNKNGMSAAVIAYGATLASLTVPDRRGSFADVTLGFDDPAAYPKSHYHFGGIIGRFANRIASGRFVLDGKTYELAHNDGRNALHGGSSGFDKRVWSVRDASRSSVRLTRLSPDGEEGYPGSLETAVAYTLTENDELLISYEATTDKPTVLNLTNHVYFNLAGAGRGDILGHELTLYAERYLPADREHIPTGVLAPVAGTPLDFRKPSTLGARLKQVGGEPPGYDHCYALDRSGASSLSPAAELYEPVSGRLMKVYTDQPGVQLYTGNFLDGVVGKGGKAYARHSGVCLETQDFPDAPNRQDFPSTVLRPGQVYKRTTAYAFTTRGN